MDDHAMVPAREFAAFWTVMPISMWWAKQRMDKTQSIMARSLRPDAVVMDVNLPLLDGIEATRSFLRDIQGISVIGISVRNDPQVRLAMTDAGAVDFLTKESAASRLYEVILSHCPIKS